MSQVFKVRALSGPLGNLIMTVKTYRTAAARTRWLSQKHALNWVEYWGELPSGSYRFGLTVWEPVETAKVAKKEAACA